MVACRSTRNISILMILWIMPVSRLTALKFHVEFYHEDKYSGMTLLDFSNSSRMGSAAKTKPPAASLPN
jgi:hypothetical protein